MKNIFQTLEIDSSLKLIIFLAALLSKSNNLQCRKYVKTKLREVPKSKKSLSSFVFNTRKFEFFLKLRDKPWSPINWKFV